MKQSVPACPIPEIPELRRLAECRAVYVRTPWSASLSDCAAEGVAASYALSALGYERLGVGSQRRTHGAGGCVIKIAEGRAGAEDNLHEARLWRGASRSDPWFARRLAPVIDVEPNGAWLTMVRADRSQGDERLERMAAALKRQLTRHGVLSGDVRGPNVGTIRQLPVIIDYGNVRFGRIGI